MLSQQKIIEIIKTGNLLTKNASDSFRVIEIFNSLNRSNYYDWRFGKKQQDWSKKQWSEVAKEVQQVFIHYKSR